MARMKKKLLDHVSDAIITAVAKAIDLVRPGWSKKNASRINEWRLMAYAYNRSPVGVAGALMVLAFVVIAIIGPYVAPFAYDQMFTLYDFKTKLLPPGTHVVVKVLEHGKIVEKQVFYLLGSDDMGRDLFSLILYGARTSFVISIVTIALGVPLGILLGLIAGYYGGKIDEIIMRLVDIFIAFPALILAIAFAAVLPERITQLLMNNPWLAELTCFLFAIKKVDIGVIASVLSVIGALIIVWWPGYARIVRGIVLSVRENLYVEAAKAIGLSDREIMLKHILPNVIGHVIVLITLDIGSVILMEAALSFLGIGVQPPVAEWGRIIYDGAQYFPDKWWLVFFPGLAILLVVLGWNLVGDTLRDVFDPRMRRRLEFQFEEEEQP